MVRLITETSRGETNLHHPVSQTSTSQWVSISQSYHCSLFKVSSQGNRGFQEAHTHWCVDLNTSCSTPANTRGQSNPPHYRKGMWFLLCHPSSHQHHWPQTTNRQNLLPFGDLSPSPPPRMERRQIHKLFKDGVEVCLGNCQVRESSKTTHHLLHYHSWQPQVPWNRWEKQNSKDL